MTFLGPGRNTDGAVRIISLFLLLNLISGLIFAGTIIRGHDEHAYLRDVQHISKLPFSRWPQALTKAVSPFYAFLSSGIFALLSPLGFEARLFLVRIFGLLLSTATVYLAWLIAGAILPEERSFQFLIPAFLIFTPQYNYVMASANKDSLLVFLATLTVYLLLRGEERGNFQAKDLLLLGLLLGLGVLTKARFMVVLPAVLLVLFWQAGRHLRTKERRYGVHLFFVTILIFGGLVFLLVRAVGFFQLPQDYAWARERGVSFVTYSQLSIILSVAFYRSTIDGFWFGWTAFRDSALGVGAGIVLRILTGVSLFGLFWFLGERFLNPRTRRGQDISVSAESEEEKGRRQRMILLLLIVFASSVIANLMYRLFLSDVEGRYLYVAIAPATVLLTLGLREFVPHRFSGYALIFFVLCLSIVNFEFQVSIATQNWTVFLVPWVILVLRMLYVGLCMLMIRVVVSNAGFRVPERAK